MLGNKLPKTQKVTFIFYIEPRLPKRSAKYVYYVSTYRTLRFLYKEPVYKKLGLFCKKTSETFKFIWLDMVYPKKSFKKMHEETRPKRSIYPYSVYFSLVDIDPMMN